VLDTQDIYLNTQQVEALRKGYSIYVTVDGKNTRIKVGM
jgi:hypothetical protein